MMIHVCNPNAQRLRGRRILILRLPWETQSDSFTKKTKQNKTTQTMSTKDKLYWEYPSSNIVVIIILKSHTNQRNDTHWYTYVNKS